MNEDVLKYKNKINDQLQQEQITINELIEIWRLNNVDKYPEEYIDAIGIILKERQVDVPAQEIKFSKKNMLKSGYIRLMIIYIILAFIFLINDYQIFKENPNALLPKILFTLSFLIPILLCYLWYSFTLYKLKTIGIRKLAGNILFIFGTFMIMGSLLFNDYNQPAEKKYFYFVLFSIFIIASYFLIFKSKPKIVKS
jgi:magnesium-transporting ATPase (P-type)